MLRRFLRDSLIYGIANILTSGISVILLPLYTRWLSPRDYGIIDMLTVFKSLISLTIALEITQGFARYFAGEGDARARSEYASTTLWFTTIVYTLFLITVVTHPAFWGRLLIGSSDERVLIHTMGLVIWSHGIMLFAKSHLRWNLQPRLYAFASLSYTVISTLSSIVFVVVLRLGVMGVCYGELLGTLSSAALSLYSARDDYLLIFDIAKFKRMLRFSIPLVPSSIGVFVANYIDRIAIKELLSLSDVGIFGIAYRIASIVGLVTAAFRTSVMPIVLSNYHDAQTPRELARIFRYFTAFALLIFVILSIFTREILVIMVVPEYYSAGSIVPLLIPSFFLSTMYIFTPGPTIEKKTGIMAVINIFGAILNTVLNLTLIPLAGISGSALATLTSSTVIAVLYMIASQKLYYVPHNWLQIGVAVVVAGVVVWFGTRLEWSPGLAVFVKIGLIALTGGVFVLIGLIKRTEIVRILSLFQDQLHTRFKYNK